MRVKCSLCDKIDTIDSWSFEAKRLRNKPAKTYMCQTCQERITAEMVIKNGRIARGRYVHFLM